jgi:uncharacterized protein (UPF0335 family)
MYKAMEDKGMEDKGMTDKARDIIEDLRAQGYDDKQISDAMADGEYLGKAGIDQDAAEEVYNITHYKGK